MRGVSSLAWVRVALGTWGCVALSIRAACKNGGPWEQQDGYEVANNRFFVDLGVISGPVHAGPVYVSCWSSECVKKLFIVMPVSRL